MQASLLARGVLQNLVVYETAKGKFAVAAGAARPMPTSLQLRFVWTWPITGPRQPRVSWPDQQGRERRCVTPGRLEKVGDGSGGQNRFGRKTLASGRFADQRRAGQGRAVEGEGSRVTVTPSPAYKPSFGIAL
jgi:hypothetical protein